MIMAMTGVPRLLVDGKAFFMGWRCQHWPQAAPTPLTIGLPSAYVMLLAAVVPWPFTPANLGPHATVAPQFLFQVKEAVRTRLVLAFNGRSRGLDRTAIGNKRDKSKQTKVMLAADEGDWYMLM